MLIVLLLGEAEGERLGGTGCAAGLCVPKPTVTATFLGTIRKMEGHATLGLWKINRQQSYERQAKDTRGRLVLWLAINLLTLKYHLHFCLRISIALENIQTINWMVFFLLQWGLNENLTARSTKLKKKREKSPPARNIVVQYFKM